MDTAESLKNRVCLVTGGAGFGGSHLCSELIRRGAKVYVYDRCYPENSYLNFIRIKSKVNCIQGDIRDLDYLKMVITRFEVEFVFHLAAQAIKPQSNYIPYETFKVNALGTYNVLEAVRTAKEKPGLVFASTGGYYGTFFSEALIDENACPQTGDNIYSASKVAGDIAVRYYVNTFGIRAATCRFMQTYGPGDTNFSRLIPITVRYLMNAEQPRLSRCDGTPQWDFMHVRDMANAYIKVAENLDNESVSGEAFNFGGGKPISVKELVMLIAKIFTGKEIEPVISVAPKGVLQKTCLDISKAESLLGWKPEIGLEQGLEETITWYRDIWNRI